MLSPLMMMTAGELPLYGHDIRSDGGGGGWQTDLFIFTHSAFYSVPLILCGIIFLIIA